jgi:3-deoxy-D-manno-octulosonate 8-phosphate phosphatase (KDO 8-P phosphatase)
VANFPYLTDVPADVLARAALVRLAVFDVDGTLTDGKLPYGGGGHDGRQFNVHDGLGLQSLRAHGIEVALITARQSQAVAMRAADLGLRHVFQAQADKRACLLALLASLQLQPHEACYVGDDLPDLRPMRVAGLAVAVANAHPWLLAHAHWQTTRLGGDGAAREVCDLLLQAQGKAAAELARWQ